MFDKLQDLKNKGYIPDTILDIGAHKGEWTNETKRIFPTSKYFLFESINYPQLRNVQCNGVFIVTLNDCVKEVDWYELQNTGDSMFKEKTSHFVNVNPTKKQTIDLNSLIPSIVSESKQILMKIDCQGAEIPILKGATSFLHKVDFILMEMPLFGCYNEGVPGFLTHIQFMDSMGFVPFDLASNHYINGFNMQIDMLFINKSHPWNTKVQELLLKL
jgi:FkbM family methyltransferase